MFFVFFNNFFNWIKNVGSITNSLLVNFKSEIWNNVESIYYFLFISNQLIIFTQIYLEIGLTLFEKRGFTLLQNVLLSLRFLICTLRKRCSELFWSTFPCIRTRITPNTDTFYSMVDSQNMIFQIYGKYLHIYFFVCYKPFINKPRVTSTNVFFPNRCKFV